MKNWVQQNKWSENIAAIISTYCDYYNIKISQKTIFDKYCGDNKMAHFKTVIEFCNDWNIQYLQVNFVEQHLSSDFAPAFVLMDGYRTQLFIEIKDDQVVFVDSLTGWQTETKSDFFNRSKGTIVFLDHSNYNEEENYQLKRDKELDFRRIEERKWIAPQVKLIRPDEQIESIKPK